MRSKNSKIHDSNHYLYGGGKERIKAANKIAVARNKEFLKQQKDNKKCKDCGLVFRHWQLQYDHLPGNEKFRTVSQLSYSSGSIGRIEKEIQKCELVCANCHADRTWLRSHAADS